VVLPGVAKAMEGVPASRLVAAAATTALMGIVIVFAVQQQRGAREAERQRLLKVLAEISRRFYRVCRELSSISTRVRSEVVKGSVDITETKLQAQLTTQCQVLEKLESIQREVTLEFGIAPEEVAMLQQRLAPVDEEVNSYAEGFKSMLTDALAGMPPILPNVKIPPALTEEAALDVISSVNALELQKLAERLACSKALTMEELGQAMVTARTEAEAEAVQAKADLFGVDDGENVYHSATATYARRDEFAKAWKKRSDAHQEKLYGLLQLKSRLTAQVSGAPANVGEAAEEKKRRRQNARAEGAKADATVKNTSDEGRSR
jgi:hypothetical protein